MFSLKQLKDALKSLTNLYFICHHPLLKKRARYKNITILRHCFFRRLGMFYDDISDCFINKYILPEMWNLYNNFLINIE